MQVGRNGCRKTVKSIALSVMLPGLWSVTSPEMTARALEKNLSVSYDLPQH